MLCSFGFKVFIDELGSVTHFHELAAHNLSLTGKLIALHDNFSLRVDIFTDLLTLYHILPSVPEVSFSVFTSVHEHSSEELFLEVAFLSAHSHIMQG